MAGRNAPCFEIEPLAIKDNEGRIVSFDFSANDKPGGYRTSSIAKENNGSPFPCVNVNCPCGCGKTTGWFGTLAKDQALDIEYPGHSWKGALVDGTWTEDV